MLPIKLKAECNGTGPTNRQLQGKVGGVTPAGLSLPSGEPRSSIECPEEWQTSTHAGQV
jgi:hypothetical protein